ncbi:MAG: hypothetical protein ACWA5U_09855 [bacterium]
MPDFQYDLAIGIAYVSPVNQRVNQLNRTPDLSDKSAIKNIE